MNKLLIHNDNTSFNRDEFFTQKESFKFDVDYDKDVDFYIHDNLTKGDLFNKLSASDIVFVKVSLSQNYLEYLGIRLAYHIRLTKSLGEKVNKIPIVFICEESIQFLGRTYAEPSILITEGVYFIKESKSEFDAIINTPSVRGLKEMESFVNSILINPPANYLSHHSITNEWSAIRWSEVLGISADSELRKIKKNIDGLLYYKYLRYKYPISKNQKYSTFKIEGTGKVLYIDDENEKGWDVVMHELISKNNDITLETFKYDFKDKTQEKIVKECKKKVETFDPDLVVLDLRLSDSDFENSTNASDFTGYKVLEEIKKINEGIQIIMITASNKVWNHSELIAAGSDGYIIKESPELSVDHDYSHSALQNIADSVSVGLEMSFLKKLFEIISLIKSVITTDNTLWADFKLRLENNLDIASQLLKNTKLSKKNFNWAYLQLFHIIEDFSNYKSVIEYSYGQCIIHTMDGNKIIAALDTNNRRRKTAIKFIGGKYHLGEEPNYTRELDTNFRVSAILILLLGNKNSSVKEWTSLYTKRNQIAAHFNRTTIINEFDIENILFFINYFIDPKNQSSTNIDNGLEEPKIEHGDIDALRSRFNRR